MSYYLDDRHDAWKDGYDTWKLASPDDEGDPREECTHEDYEIGYDGLARCGDCGTTFDPSPAEIMDQRHRIATYDKYCRPQERLQVWRDRWIAWVLEPTLPLRMWLQSMVWRAFPKRRRINRFLSNHDEIPF